MFFTTPHSLPTPIFLTSTFLEYICWVLDIPLTQMFAHWARSPKTSGVVAGRALEATGAFIFPPHSTQGDGSIKGNGDLCNSQTLQVWIMPEWTGDLETLSSSLQMIHENDVGKHRETCLKLIYIFKFYYWFQAYSTSVRHL